ncbi:myo-inositol-1(or 4)-monophosphatase [Microcella putealis]|uniref:Inositol-1-monophosphatase n=1 Tax=Microcella putealis TaxID=337005 RepID=A0A4Q7LLQ1_9MICO|nr:inositol monophosphatase family protein [Microcella putealis]RZS55141.1 myo-inositol-1(or 4)-monophosphatase [Microcella putealis]TQM23597.1 myo-inositol-1(or 4)-monophosphatase [Microcella putealis]
MTDATRASDRPSDSALLELALEIALEAGRMIAAAREGTVTVADRKSSVTDVVTQVDRDAEALIRDRIRAARPDDAFFGEESGGDAGSSGLTWVVDPIDGTVNFLYGIPHYAVSIAVVEGPADPATWVERVGVVHNPATGETFTAVRGGGAFLGDRALRIPEPPQLAEALIATGFAYDADIRAEQGAAVAAMLPRVRDIRRLGTASLDLCNLAAGRVDAYAERTLNPWDHAAGGLIVAEAGGVVVGRHGAAPSRDFVIAVHPELLEPLEALLDEVGA